MDLQWPARRLWVGAKEVSGVKLKLSSTDGASAKLDGPLTIRGLAAASSTTALTVTLKDGVTSLPALDILQEELQIEGRWEGDAPLRAAAQVPIAPGWMSLVPALLAIALALITREVLWSLLGGIFAGAWILHGSLLAAFPRSWDVLVQAIADPDHAKILMFTLTIGGLVGVIGANGGTGGVVKALSRLATSPRSGVLSTWALGLAIFFDGYSSMLLVGTTMRPVTDKLKISREKLAYVVDSTSATMASLAIISTWIGYEVAVLADAIKASKLPFDAYQVFLSGLPMRFYPIYALAFVVFVAVSGKDFGPMLTAERRARREGKLIRDGGTPLMDTSLLDTGPELKDRPVGSMWLAGGPLISLVLGVLVVPAYTGLSGAQADPKAYADAVAGGWSRQLGFILSNADSFNALLYGGGFGAAVAILVSLATRSLSLKTTSQAFVRGLQSMLLAVTVLVLAWSIGALMGELHAGRYVADLVGDSLPTWSLSTVTFFLAAIIPISTGTSWGTMAILMPIVIPVVAVHSGNPDFGLLLYGATSAVLAGAVFGDHCSPIADTTVLSSIASGSDHVDHTRTQAPYAFLCAGAAVGLGTLPAALGVPVWLIIPVGLAALYGVLQLLGQRPEAPGDDDAPAEQPDADAP